jgi:hypothetical protein
VAEKKAAKEENRACEGVSASNGENMRGIGSTAGGSMANSRRARLPAFNAGGKHIGRHRAAAGGGLKSKKAAKYWAAS